MAVKGFVLEWKRLCLEEEAMMEIRYGGRYE